MKIINVSSLGLIGDQVLRKAGNASITGKTSRGLFITLDQRWVIFLSCEPFRGPLTFNIKDGSSLLAGIDLQSPVQIRDGDLYFPHIDAAIRTSSADVWESIQENHTFSSECERSRLIKTIGVEILKQRKNAGLISYLTQLLGIENQYSPPPTKFPFGVDICQLKQTIDCQDERKIISMFSKYIGLGSGLTPSGDDLVSGFLLATSRYQNTIFPGLDRPFVFSNLMGMAYRKTSLLSANLIECACRGQADERLVHAVDGIMAGTIDPATCVDLLLSWGNSSGGDAFLGMALAAYQTL